MVAKRLKSNLDEPAKVALCTFLVNLHDQIRGVVTNPRFPERGPLSEVTIRELLKLVGRLSSYPDLKGPAGVDVSRHVYPIVEDEVRRRAALDAQARVCACVQAWSVYGARFGQVGQRDLREAVRSAMVFLRGSGGLAQQHFFFSRSSAPGAWTVKWEEQKGVGRLLVALAPRRAAPRRAAGQGSQAP